MSPRTAHSHRRRRGFTLIEAALTTVIVGSGVLSTVILFAACTKENSVAANTTTAMMLAGNIQEMMEGLSFNDPAYGSTYFGPEPGETLATYNDCDDFDGLTFNPPIDATCQPIAALSPYSQVVSVVPVYATQPGSNTNPAAPDLPKTTYTGALRVQVRILYKPNGLAATEVYRTSWVRVAS